MRGEGSPSRWFSFRQARVAVLLAILIVVVAYAIHDVRSRQSRKAWDHTLAVAIVVMRQPAEAGGVDDATISALRERTPTLAARLESELHRYAPSAPKPFAFTVLGPIDGAPPAPVTSGDGLMALASHAWALWRWTSDVDSRAALASGAYDSRIYVTAEVPTGKRHMVEGTSEQGGRVGVVTVDLDASAVDYALSVIAHELFHTLDATDEYGDDGRTKIPSGLAEPELEPRWPQRYVEVMARARPLSPTKEVSLDTLDELAVGSTTAREVGWAK